MAKKKAGDSSGGLFAGIDEPAAKPAEPAAKPADSVADPEVAFVRAESSDVQYLIEHGEINPELVYSFSRTRAKLVRREIERWRIVRERRMAVEAAGGLYTPPPREEVERIPPAVRAISAEELRQSLASGDGLELAQTLSMSMHAFTEAECVRLAGYLIKLLEAK